MEELWKPIEGFERYRVSSFGRVENAKSGRLLKLNLNQYGVLYVGLSKDGEQAHRSVPLLVASAFIKPEMPTFDTPINLNNDPWDNRVENLALRPRWFAVQYKKQFRHAYANPIQRPIRNVKTGEISADSLQCCMRYGLLENELVLSIMNQTYTWPGYLEFEVVQE